MNRKLVMFGLSYCMIAGGVLLTNTACVVRRHTAAPPPQQTVMALALLVNTDLRRSLPEVLAPALVVAGTRDTLVPLAATQALAAALPRATHAAIAGASHAPFLSHPAPFLDALRSFADG